MPLNVIVFSDDEVPTRAKLESLYANYKDAVDYDKDLGEGETWGGIIDRASIEEEEHNPKLVYVQRLLWKRFDHRSLFRIAAANFTTTPEVSKIEDGIVAGADRPC